MANSDITACYNVFSLEERNIFVFQITEQHLEAELKQRPATISIHKFAHTHLLPSRGEPRQGVKVIRLSLFAVLLTMGKDQF